MANRRFTSQFSYSFEKMPVKLMGSILQTDAGAFAARTINSITYTARTMGSAGNSITITITGGGTAGAEVVTVSGTAITVQIESGVSTRDQVKTAIEAESDADELISVTTSSGGSAASTSTVLPLQNGDDTDFTSTCKGFSVTQTGTGVYEISLEDSYSELIGASLMLMRTAAVDLMPQLQEVDVSDSDDPKIVFRMQAAATPTNMANDDQLFIELTLRNS